MTSSLRLSWLQKLVYGSGDWGISSYITFRQIFYAIFLTDVVGLPPWQASLAMFIGILWDAINDPLVGRLSDRVNLTWGRRSFLAIFALPFGLGFLLHWWSPPWSSSALRMLSVTLALMISDTFQTLVSVPYHAMMPEIAPDYDERTNLSGFRMVFNLAASVVTAVVAPEIIARVSHAGGGAQQGYWIAAALLGVLAALPFLLIALLVPSPAVSSHLAPRTFSFYQSITLAWRNIPFRLATLLYVLNWITIDLLAMMLPFVLVYYVAQGDRLAKVQFFDLRLTLESAAMGILLVTALLAIPFWAWLAKKVGKIRAYLAAISFWICIQMVLWQIKPGQVGMSLAVCALAGLSVSAAHVLPEAIFPDVLEWGELRSGAGQAGIYYGVKNFLRKLSGALAGFLALQYLGWNGYQTPPAGALHFTQPVLTQRAILFLTGPMGAILLVGAFLAACFFPLTPYKIARIQRLLARRRERIP